MKVTSTDKLNDAFAEKDEKYWEWTIPETQEEIVLKVVMMPLIISHDRAVHRGAIKKWKAFAPDIQVDWVRMARNVLGFNVVIVGKCFKNGTWVSEAWQKSHPDELADEPDGPPERMPPAEEPMKLCL